MSDNKHQITVAEAAAMTERFRESRPQQYPVCETFEADSVSSLLANTGCRYLRIYYGADTGGNVHAILVGANEKNEDMLPSDGDLPQTEDAGTGAGGILEDGYRCPQDCPPKSKLNS